MVVAILYQKVNYLSLPLRYYLRNIVYFCRKPVPMSTIPRDPLGLGRQKAPPPKNPAVCSLRSSRLKSTALRLYPFRLVLCRKLCRRSRCSLKRSPYGFPFVSTYGVHVLEPTACCPCLYL